MVIDSSALIGLLLAEPETADFVAALAAASSRLISAPTYLETAIVILARSGPQAQEKLDQLLDDLGIEVVPFAREQSVLAIPCASASAIAFQTATVPNSPRQS